MGVKIVEIYINNTEMKEYDFANFCGEMMMRL